jgi:energy-coupling factor transporter ATP-binding protein EcfA2
MPPILPTIKKGLRVVVAGRTGCGKTTLANFLLSRSNQHWVILNPKHTAGYAKLPDSNILRRVSGSTAKLNDSIVKHRYTIINFSGNESNPEFLDAVIKYLHENFSNVGLCVDELYTVHSNGRPGEGLVGWLTRGRELGQSFIGLTQRPAWISKFVFSEADAIAGMDLTLPEDRKKMRENTGHEGFMVRLPAHHWRWYNVAADAAQLWGPVPL